MTERFLNLEYVRFVDAKYSEYFFFFFLHFHFVSLFPRRPFTVPQVLRKGNKPELEEEEEDEEEDTLQVLKLFQNSRSDFTEKNSF